MELKTNMWLTFIALRARWAFSFGLEGLLCRHNEPVSEQHDGPKTKGFLYCTITVRDFIQVHSRVIACHDYATLVDGVF